MYVKTALLSLLLIGVSGLRADVTLRYKTEVNINPNLPSAMQGLSAMDAVIPHEMILQYRDGKGATSQGAMTSIADFAKQELTILDHQGKRYSTLPYAQYADAATAAMPRVSGQAAGMLAGMKTHSESKITGHSATIQGIEADEREFDITIDPPDLPNMPAVPGPMIRLVMHFWMAKPGEIIRVPAVREVLGYGQFAAATMNPMSSVEKILGQMPLTPDIMGLIKDLHSAGTNFVLRTQVEMFMPMLDALFKRTPAGASPFGANFDPSAPLMTMNQELASISTETVSEAAFRVPDGYQPAPAADILKDLMAKAQAPGKQ
ncbi:MAG TPA: hypothetical protein VMH05_00110 [Bryobacteraceae bacterium]|nr:hypothetical protein [Bryobacteraceae bacterium]